MCTWNQFRSRKACRGHIPHKEHCWVMAWYWTSWGFWEIAIQIPCLMGRCGCDKVQVRKMLKAQMQIHELPVYARQHSPHGLSPKMQTLDSNRIRVKKKNKTASPPGTLTQLPFKLPKGLHRPQPFTNSSIMVFDPRRTKLLIDQRICLCFWPLFGHLQELLYSNRTRTCVPHLASGRGKKCKNVKYKKVNLGLPHDTFSNNPVRKGKVWDWTALKIQINDKKGWDGSTDICH